MLELHMIIKKVSKIAKKIANTKRKKMLMPDVKIKTPQEKTIKSV